MSSPCSWEAIQIHWAKLSATLPLPQCCPDQGTRSSFPVCSSDELYQRALTGCKHWEKPLPDESRNDSVLLASTRLCIHPLFKTRPYHLKPHFLASTGYYSIVFKKALHCRQVYFTFTILYSMAFVSDNKSYMSFLCVILVHVSLVVPASYCFK